jgi:hypothetical protein
MAKYVMPKLKQVALMCVYVYVSERNGRRKTTVKFEIGKSRGLGGVGYVPLGLGLHYKIS